MNARDTRETLSDSEGGFEFKVPPGQWMLQARKGTLGGEAGQNFAGQLITEGNGKAYDAAIHMERRCRVYGRIYDNQTNKLIPFGRLWTSDRFLVTADAEGRYEIEGQRQGYQTLIALCSGYERKYVIYTPIMSEEMELDLYLKRGAKVRGQVVDSRGAPLAHAWVWRPMSGRGSISGNYEVCDENGRFEFDGLPFGQKVTLEARMPCYENVCFAFERVPGETVSQPKKFVLQADAAPNEILLTLDPNFQEEKRAIRRWERASVTGVVTGRVVDTAGQPVRNFRILTQVPYTNIDSSYWAPIEINEEYRGFTFTSDDGSFGLTAPGWQPGQRVRLTVVVDGYGEAVVDLATVQRPGSPSTTRPIVLRLEPTGQLAVKVTQKGLLNRPVSAARVTVREYNSNLEGAFDWHSARSPVHRPTTLFTDNQGWARFTGLSLAQGVVLVEKNGYGRKHVSWNTGENRLTVPVVQEEAIIEGQALDAERGPIEKGTVWLRWADTFPYDYANPDHSMFHAELKPEDQGRFKFNQLPPGGYTLTVTSQDKNGGPTYHRYADEFTLKAGDLLQVTYPDDAIANNPDRWLAESTGDPGDKALREKLIGAWYRDGFSGSGAPVRTVWHFGENSGLELWFFKPPNKRVYADGSYSSSEAWSAYDVGMFKVEAGSVSIAWENGGLLRYTKVEFPDPDTLVLVRAGQRAEDPVKRTDQLDRVLREGVIMSRPLPATAL